MSDEETKVDEQSVETPETEPTPEDVLGAEAFEEPTVGEPPKDEPTEDKSASAEEPAKDSDTEPEKPEKDESEPDAKADEEPVSEMVPYVVNYGGIEQEIQVTAEVAKALDAQHKTALQFPHLQGKYQEMQKAGEEAAAIARTKLPTEEGGPAEFNPEVFIERMKPAVDDAVKRGAISEEFNEMYPEMAANMTWGAMRLDAYERALRPVVTQYATTALEQEQGRVKTEVYDGMAKLASDRPDLYGDLSDQNARDGLFEFMIQLNVDTALLTEAHLASTLEKMWGSYQGPKILEAAKAAAEKARLDQEEKRRVAGGGGSGGGGREAPANSALADIHSILGER
jgi:hypothetical protein